jgi:putative FmdB family regulatory protein
MPIYEFECGSCGDRFDRLQKLSDPDPTICPECGKATVKRRVTAPSFRLSGSGWYETDFKKDGDKKRNLTDKGESAPSESKSADSSSTPASSTPAKSTDATSAESKSKPAEKSKPAAETKVAPKSESTTHK